MVCFLANYQGQLKANLKYSKPTSAEGTKREMNTVKFWLEPELLIILSSFKSYDFSKDPNNSCEFFNKSLTAVLF
jgi:hypothetical protein